jgi:hypothetical protein
MIHSTTAIVLGLAALSLAAAPAAAQRQRLSMDPGHFTGATAGAEQPGFDDRAGAAWICPTIEHDGTPRECWQA